MPKDLFIGIRQFLGYLGPGCLWVTVWLVATHNDSPASLVNKPPSGVLIAVFFVASLLVGYATVIVCFPIGIEISRLIREKADPWTPASLRLPQKCETMAERARSIAQAKYPHFANSLHDRSELYVFCKEFVIEHSVNFRSRLDNAEAEINLRANFPLPLCAFALVMLQQDWRISICATVVAFLLVWQVEAQRRSEECDALRAFLIIHLDPKATP